jgi:phage terminase large subunit-like protein
MIASAYDHRRQVADYIEGVTSGDIVAGRLVRLAVERHVADLEHAGDRGWYFDPYSAETALDFFATLLVHSIGRWDGEPFDPAPWQKFCLWSIFGWKGVDTKRRRFRRAYLSVARKNGKTTLASGLPLFCMYLDDPIEAGAQIYCVATKEEQAMLLWRESVRMLKRAPAIMGVSTLRHKRIIFPSYESYFAPLGSDSDSTDGLNPHVVVKDELHAWQERHRGLHEKLSTGGGAREQPLELIITTAGDDKSTIWQEEDDYARKVVESVITGDIIDDRLFAFVARIDDDDDPFDEECWEKANPNLHVSVNVDYLRMQANEARQKPTAFNSFVRYHCNRRVTSSERAIKPELWKAAARKDPAIGENPWCHGGFDLGRSDDFSAIAVCWAWKDGDETRYHIRSRSFTCKLSPMVEREPIRSWIRNDLIAMDDGNAVDFNEVQRAILQWHDEFTPATWAFDKTFAKQMAMALTNEHGLEMFEFTQGHRYYNEPVREFLRSLADGRITHDGDPVLTWQALNLTISRNPRDEWMPDKSDPKQKIDAMVAVLMAFSECLFAEKSKASVYESRGIVSVEALDRQEEQPSYRNHWDDDEDD